MRKCLFLSVFALAALITMSSAITHAQSAEAIAADKPASVVVAPKGAAQTYTESTTPSEGAKKVFYQAVDAAGDLVNSALSYMGISYKYGGNAPDTGFDCSGFVRYVYNNTLGLMLPRSSAEMSKTGEKVKKDELKPGDLVFFNTLKRAFSHVGIYIGEGNFVHAPSTGGAVRVESMEIPYWQKRFNGARRMDTHTLTPSIEQASTNQATSAITPKDDALDVLMQNLSANPAK